MRRRSPQAVIPSSMSAYHVTLALSSLQASNEKWSDQRGEGFGHVVGVSRKLALEGSNETEQCSAFQLENE